MSAVFDAVQAFIDHFIASLREAKAGLSPRELIFGFGLAFVLALLAFLVMAARQNTLQAPGDGSVAPPPIPAARGFRIGARSGLCVLFAFLAGLATIYGQILRDLWPAPPEQWTNLAAWKDILPPSDWFAWIAPLGVAAWIVCSLAASRGFASWLGLLLEAGLAYGVAHLVIAPLSGVDRKWTVEEGERWIWIGAAALFALRLNVQFLAARRRGATSWLIFAVIVGLAGHTLGFVGSATGGKILGVLAATLAAGGAAVSLLRRPQPAHGAWGVAAWVFGFLLLFGFTRQESFDHGSIVLFAAAPLTLWIGPDRGSHRFVGLALRATAAAVFLIAALGRCF